MASERRSGSVFTLRFTVSPWLISTFLLHMAVSLLAFGWCPESVRMLPVRPALSDLEAPGWGEPRFPLCAFVASWLTDFVWHCRVVAGSLLFSHAIPIPEVIYNVIISSDMFQLTMN